MDLAAKSLPTGTCERARVEQAARLLQQSELLQPPEITARLDLNDDGTFRFESTLRSGYATNDVVHGRLLRVGKAWRTRPVVILVHGWNAELHYLHILPRVARALNRRGLNAALIELPFHLHRRPSPETPGMHDFISDDLPGMIQATRQSICDLHALARWVREQGCPKVGLWGFSLGAWLAGLYICESDLAAAAVLTTPISDLDRAVRELPFCHPVRAGMNGTALDLHPLNLAGRTPLIPREAIRITQSAYDLFVPSESYEALSMNWKLPGWEKVPQSHISVLLSRKTMNASMDWLARILA